MQGSRGRGGGGGGGGGRERRGNPRDRSPPLHRAPRRSPSPLVHLRRPHRRNLSPLPPRSRSRSPLTHRGPLPRCSLSPLPACRCSPQAELQRDREHRERDREYAIHGKQVRRQDDDGLELQHKYMLPDHPTDLTSNLNPNLQLNRSMKDRDLLTPTGIMDRQGLLLQKSMFLDDGLARTYFSLPQDNQGHTGDMPALNPSGSMRSNIGVEMHRYHERSRDPFNDVERNQKDALFSNMMAPVQSRPLVGSSSSSFPKDGNFLGFYTDHDGIGKLSDDPLQYNGYSQVKLPELLRRAPLSPAAREEWLDYGHVELSRRGRDEERQDYGHGELSRRARDDPLYAESDTVYRKVSWEPRSEYRNTLGPSFSELAGERGDRADASQKKLSESSYWDLPRSSHGDTVMDFGGLKGPREEYDCSGGGYMTFRMRSPQDRVVASFEEGYSFERDFSPMTYRARERSNSPLLVDHHRDMHRYGLSPPQAKLKLDGRSSSPLVDHHMDMLRHGVRLPQGNSSFDDDPSMYDLSPERMDRRKYWRNDDVNEHDSRGMLLNDRNIHSRIRIRSPDLGDEMWSHEEDDRPKPYITSKAAYGRSKHRMPSHRIPRKDGQAQSDGFYARGEGHRGMTVKKRLRPGPSEFHVSLASQKRLDLRRPNKYGKRGLDERHNDLRAPDGDVPVDGSHRKNNDPPENSEEFKHQVHKAFLRFTKLLNESSHQRKRYQGDLARTSNLLCCVCGSASKEFGNTHSLLAHTYNSLKPGFRTEHLGFHKALCVLMGWNFLVPADASKAYMSRCDEVKTLKEDLILWPPVVIINNSSIGSKNNVIAPKVISVEAMEDILKGMGFEVAKGRLCRGKPSNHSVLFFKFMPTFSGLQEAERLHKYYADNKRGREEFKKITSGNGSAGEAPTMKDDELMYGYMAIAEDLEKLDPETKKRCHVKSKKDIEAIADAPLNTD